MGNIFTKIEEAMVAAAFAEAGEHEYARSLLEKEKTSRQKVLLSTDCPLVTGKVLNHALNLCKRLGSALEVYQIIPMEALAATPQEFFQKGTRRLQALQEKLAKIGISYRYSIKESSLQEELANLARERRDLMAVIIPLCDEGHACETDFKKKVTGLFSCPVIFFES